MKKGISEQKQLQALQRQATVKSGQKQWLLCSLGSRRLEQVTRWCGSCAEAHSESQMKSREVSRVQSERGRNSPSEGRAVDVF